jgi:hypothetical protein
MILCCSPGDLEVYPNTRDSALAFTPLSVGYRPSRIVITRPLGQKYFVLPPSVVLKILNHLDQESG